MKKLIAFVLAFAMMISITSVASASANKVEIVDADIWNKMDVVHNDFMSAAKRSSVDDIYGGVYYDNGKSFC